jgi:hypothetical protein
MEFKEFLIVAMPFAQSDLTAEFEEFAADEKTALEQFEKRCPLFRVKSVTAR